MAKPLQAKPKSSTCSRLSTTSLDLNGSEFELKFASKNGKFQTKFGGYVTLIVSIIIVLAFILSVSELFSDNSPVVNTTKEFNPETVDINLYEEELIMPLMFKKGNKLISSAEELSRYFTVRIQAMDWVFNKTISWYSLKSFHEFPLKACSQEDKNQRITNLVDALFKNSDHLNKYLFCPDLGDKTEFLRLKKIQNNADLAFIRVRFYPCTLEDPSKCATASELDDMEVSLFSNNKILEASKFDEPIKYTLKRHRLKLDRASTKILKYKFDPNVIVDDSTQVRSEKIRSQFATITLDGEDRRGRNPSIITCTAQQIVFGPDILCDHFLEMEYMPRTDIIKIRRSYKKASIMLGEFGGYLKLLMTLVAWFYSVYSSKEMKKYLFNSLFSPYQGLNNTQKEDRKHSERPNTLGLVDSLIDVNDVLKNLNLAEILKNEFLNEHDESLISQSIFNNSILKELKKKKKN